MQTKYAAFKESVAHVHRQLTEVRQLMEAWNALPSNATKLRDQTRSAIMDQLPTLQSSAYHMIETANAATSDSFYSYADTSSIYTTLNAIDAIYKATGSQYSSSSLYAAASRSSLNTYTSPTASYSYGWYGSSYADYDWGY